MKLSLSFIFSLCLLTFLNSNLFASTQWNRFDTDYYTVYYDSEIPLKSISKKLYIPNGILRKYNSQNVSKRDVEEHLKVKLDSIFQRTQAILTMYPKGINLQLKIYKSTDELKEKYKDMYKCAFKNRKGESYVISFYRNQDNTIYISYKDLRTAILAHETAHCIIAHYFLTPPPVKAQEILAVYVDQHFNDF